MAESGRIRIDLRQHRSTVDVDVRDGLQPVHLRLPARQTSAGATTRVVEPTKTAIFSTRWSLPTVKTHHYSCLTGQT